MNWPNLGKNLRTKIGISMPVTLEKLDIREGVPWDLSVDN